MKNIYLGGSLIFIYIFSFFLLSHSINGTATYSSNEIDNDEEGDDDNNHRHHMKPSDSKKLMKKSGNLFRFRSVYEFLDCPSVLNGGIATIQVGLSLCSKVFELLEGSIAVNHINDAGWKNSQLQSIELSGGNVDNSNSGWSCLNGTCKNEEELYIGECYPTLNVTLRFRCYFDNCTVKHRFEASGKIQNSHVSIQANELSIISTCNVLGVAPVSGVEGGLGATALPKKTSMITSGGCFLGNPGTFNYYYQSYSLSSSRSPPISYPFTASVSAGPPHRSTNFQVELCFDGSNALQASPASCFERGFTIFLANRNNLLGGCPPNSEMITSVTPFFKVGDSTYINVPSTSGVTCNETACATNYSNLAASFMANVDNCFVANFSFEFNNTVALGDSNCCIFQPEFGATIEVLYEQGIPPPAITPETPPAVIGSLITTTPVLLNPTAPNCVSLENQIFGYHCWVNSTEGFDSNHCYDSTSYNDTCRFKFIVSFSNYRLLNDGLSFIVAFRALLNTFNFPDLASHPVNLTTQISLQNQVAIISCPNRAGVLSIPSCNYAKPLNLTTNCASTDPLNSENFCSFVGVSKVSDITCSDFRLTEGLVAGNPMVVDFEFYFSQSIDAFLDCDIQITANAFVKESCTSICCYYDGKITASSKKVSFYEILSNTWN